MAHSDTNSIKIDPSNDTVGIISSHVHTIAEIKSKTTLYRTNTPEDGRDQALPQKVQ